MKSLILILALLLPGLSLAQYAPGVQVAALNGTTVTYVAPTPATSVMQCTNGTLTCWPTQAGTTGSAVLGSLPATGYVFAIVPPATTAQWVTVASITASSAPSTAITIAPGPATLTWTAPTANLDGSAIAAGEIAGYNVYQSVASPVTIANSTLLTLTPVNALTFTTPPLSAGTYYFGVAAVVSSSTTPTLAYANGGIATSLPVIVPVIQVTVTPSVPTNITVTLAPQTGVTP